VQPFPPTDELSFLLGSELTQIVIDPYEVRFLLVSNRSMVELRSGNVFAHRYGDIEEVFEPLSGCQTLGPVRFHALLNQVVTALAATAAGDELALTFASGQQLTILSEVGGTYESGMISGTVDGVERLWVF
jgi:hypothetical protein